MLALVKRYRELLLIAALLVIPLFVFFAHAKRASEPSRFDRAVLAITSPIEKGIAWGISGVLRGWYGYVNLLHVRERSHDLLQELNRVRMENEELLQVRAENDRLRRLLSITESSPRRTFVGARVIGVRLDPKGLQVVTIDRGAADRIARMMPVVVAQGVVGRVHAVYPHSADVLLLIDRNSSIAARVERSRARANVRGFGDPDLCKLDYALRSEDMIEGDSLVTSGTDGVFPRGIPVGTVTRVKRTGFGLYQDAKVVPGVAVTKLEEVLVITSSERSAEEAPAAAARAP